MCLQLRGLQRDDRGPLHLLLAQLLRNSVLQRTALDITPLWCHKENWYSSQRGACCWFHLFQSPLTATTGLAYVQSVAFSRERKIWAIKSGENNSLEFEVKKQSGIYGTFNTAIAGRSQTQLKRLRSQLQFGCWLSAGRRAWDEEDEDESWSTEGWRKMFVILSSDSCLLQFNTFLKTIVSLIVLVVMWEFSTIEWMYRI